MLCLNFHMPLLNAVIVDDQIALLKATPQPSTGEIRVVNFHTSVVSCDYFHLDITYFKGDKIAMRYEAVLKLEEDRSDKGVPLKHYRFLSAQYVGERAQDFGYGDVGPFWLIQSSPLFAALNPTWQRAFIPTNDYENVVLEDVIKGMLVH